MASMLGWLLNGLARSSFLVVYTADVKGGSKENTLVVYLILFRYLGAINVSKLFECTLMHTSSMQLKFSHGARSSAALAISVVRIVFVPIFSK